jgi:ubiquinone/menaquinone biosynthesis C-methylase UbiE
MFAESYVSSTTHAKGQELDRLVEIAQPQPNWFVLDVATGGGHTALKFAPLVAKVIAMDIAPSMLQKAEAFIRGSGVDNVMFGSADAEVLPIEDEKFDLVTCRIAPHHFPEPDGFVRESARVLKAGGLLLVQDHVLPEDDEAAHYVDEFERLRDPSHYQGYPESEWVKMLEEAGLIVEHTEQVKKRHGFLTWAGRQGCVPETVERLDVMMEQASPTVLRWMQPRDWGTQYASFSNKHIIITGRKVRRDL